MGLLDWFRRRRTLPIRVWLDEPSRSAGVLAAVLDALARQANVLVVAHFPDALVQTGQELAAAGIPFTTLDRWTEAQTQQLLARRGGTVTAVLASSLPEAPAGTPRGMPAQDAAEVFVLVVDVHVLAPAHGRILHFTDHLPAPSRVQAVLSFDHPVMQVFAKPWVKTMMAQMGLKPGEVIDSPMVSRALARALQKIAGKVTGNAPCRSIDEWLRRNVRA